MLVWQEMSRRDMQLSARKTLSEIALFTAVPADLLAIVPAVIRLFSRKFSWSQTLQVEEIELPSLSITIGRDLFIVLITYAVIATIYWLVINIKTKTGEQKYNYLKLFSVSIPLAFIMPLIIILMAFGSIPMNAGLAALVVCLFTVIATLRRWRYTPSVHYQDIGFLYLICVPLLWLIFQFDGSPSWVLNLGLAWMYSAIGYLFSVLMVGGAIALFVIPIPHLGFSKRTLEIFKKVYIFNFDQGWCAVGSLGVLLLVGVLAVVIWVLILIIPIIVGAVVLGGLVVAWYFAQKS